MKLILGLCACIVVLMPCAAGAQQMANGRWDSPPPANQTSYRPDNGALPSPAAVRDGYAQAQQSAPTDTAAPPTAAVIDAGQTLSATPLPDPPVLQAAPAIPEAAPQPESPQMTPVPAEANTTGDVQTVAPAKPFNESPLSSFLSVVLLVTIGGGFWWSLGKIAEGHGFMADKAKELRARVSFAFGNQQAGGVLILLTAKQEVSAQWNQYLGRTGNRPTVGAFTGFAAFQYGREVAAGGNQAATIPPDKMDRLLSAMASSLLDDGTIQVTLTAPAPSRRASPPAASALALAGGFLAGVEADELRHAQKKRECAEEDERFKHGKRQDEARRLASEVGSAMFQVREARARGKYDDAASWEAHARAIEARIAALRV